MSRAALPLSAIPFAFVMFCASVGQSAQENLLFCFGGYNGLNPVAGMTEVNGVLYGTAEFGGNGSCSSDFGSGCGVVFSFDSANKQETVVYAFAGGTADGELPYSRLRYAKGVLYGTTYMGGSSDLYCYNSFGSGCGTVFSINLTTGAEAVLYKFQGGGTDGIYPVTAPFLMDGKSPELFGTTMYGGTGSCPYDGQGCGTVFEIDMSTGTETIVYSFQNNGTDALWPTHDWVQHSGILYSTTTEGGTYDEGTIFSVNPSTGSEKVVHSFGSGSDGQSPYAGMTELNGILYGTTFGGGNANTGTLFSFDPAKGKERVLYSFAGSNGANPVSDLIHEGGLLYGTTSKGSSGGVVFSFDPGTGTENIVADGIDLGNDPYENTRLLHLGGVLYDTTPQAEGCYFKGSIYSVTP